MKDEGQLNDRDEKFHSCGIWPLASHINHSCYNNAQRSFIGNMMIVRATQDLDPETEITFWYQSPFDSQYMGKEMNLHHWGFQGSCEMCQDLQETKASVLTKRERLRVDLIKAFQHKKPNTAKIEAMLSELSETYDRPASEIPRVSMWQSYLTLATVYAAHGQPQEAVDSAFRTLESLGYVVEGGRLPHIPGKKLQVRKWGLVTDGLVGCWMGLASAYYRLGHDIEAQAEKYARITYKICVGEDETFDETYSTASENSDGFLVTAK